MKIRKKYGITPFTKLEWIEYKEGMILVIPHPKDPISIFRGSSKKRLVKALLKVREEERRFEEKRDNLTIRQNTSKDLGE